MNRMLQYGAMCQSVIQSHSESHSAFGWWINTHRPQRSFRIIIASSPHCCNPIIRRVHAGVSDQALDPLLSSSVA